MDEAKWSSFVPPVKHVENETLEYGVGIYHNGGLKLEVSRSKKDLYNYFFMGLKSGHGLTKIWFYAQIKEEWGSNEWTEQLLGMGQTLLLSTVASPRFSKWQAIKSRGTGGTEKYG